VARPCAKKGGDAPPAKGDGGVDEAAKGGAGAEDEGKWGGPKIYVGFLGRGLRYTRPLLSST